MTLKKRDVESILPVKGFKKEYNNHVCFRYITEDGKRTSIFTYFSHGAKGGDIGDSLVATMARQCKITLGQFRRLVSCDLDRHGYEALLIEKEILGARPPLP